MSPRREAHAHIAQHGRAMSMVDLVGAASGDEMLVLLAEGTGVMDAGDQPGWVLAHVVRPEAWDEPRWPTIDDLDQATGERPCLAWCFDYHALMLNTAGLAAIGLAPDAHQE